ncbi:hypothetical protein HFP72_32915 [Nocardiopsis sp. ARC36]
MPLDHNMSDSSRKAIEVLTGIQVPKAGIANLGRASEIYTALDQRLAVLEDLFDLSRKHARRHFDGHTADRYEHSLDQFTRGENNYVGSARDNSTVMSAELFKARANVEYMHMMVIGQFVQLLAEIAWAIAMAKFTFGASLKWIPVFKAIRSLAMRRILTWLLITVPGHQIISQIFASMDSIIQRIQIGRGTRHHRDSALTASAHKGAAIEGVLSAVFSAGMDGLFSKHLSDLFTNGLKHLNDLPDPPPLVRTGPDGPPPAGPPPARPCARPRRTPARAAHRSPRRPPAGPVRDDPPPVNRDTDTPPPPGGGPDGPPTGPVKDDPPANPDRGSDSPAPKDTGPTPVPAPAPKEGPPASPSLNKDLAEVFGRHNDEFLTPYNPASPTGAGAFDNAAKAAAARQDFAEVFARNFGDHLGEAAARDLGRDYAATLARHWNDPDLGRHLRDTIGDRLPPHMRDHLADVPVNLQRPLGEYFSTTGAYTQQVGGSIGTGALEGYLGEGLGSLADGRGWEASGYSATAGATQAGIQQGATDGILHGTELFKDKDKPDLSTPAPQQTQSASPAGTGPEAVGNGSARPPAASGPERWDGGQGGDPGGQDRGGQDRGRGGDHAPGPDRDRGGEGPQREDGRGEGPVLSGTDDESSLYDRDDLSDIDDVPDLVSDTDSDSDSEFGDTDSDFGDPDDRDRDQADDDTVRVHQDEDVRTPYPDPFKTPENDKDPYATTEAKHPGLGNDLFHPGMNDGPLTVNFLNAIVPDNPMATPPPGAEQTTPNTQATPTTGNDHGTNPADRSTPAPEQHTAPPVMAAPIGQAAPPPATAPQNTATDNNQRSTPTERNSGGRPSQNTGDTPTPDSSTDRSPRDGDTSRVVTEGAPPAPETETTSTPVDQHNQSAAADEQRTATASEHTPEQQTSPTEVPLPPSPVTESDGLHDTDTTAVSGPPQDAEDTGPHPSDRDGEQPDQRDEDTPGTTTAPRTATRTGPERAGTEPVSRTTTAPVTAKTSAKARNTTPRTRTTTNPTARTTRTRRRTAGTRRRRTTSPLRRSPPPTARTTSSRTGGRAPTALRPPTPRSATTPRTSRRRRTPPPSRAPRSPRPRTAAGTPPPASATRIRSRPPRSTAAPTPRGRPGTGLRRPGRLPNRTPTTPGRWLRTGTRPTTSDTS